MLKINRYYPGLELSEYEVECLNDRMKAEFLLANTPYSEDENEIPIPANLPDKNDIYLSAIKRYSRELEILNSLPKVIVRNIPTVGISNPGWHVWENGTWSKILLPPSGSVYSLDIETYQVSETKWMPFCCTAYDLITHVWYQWYHNPEQPEELYPFSDGNIICGHNVGYDRGYMSNEYKLSSKNYFFDTLSAWQTVRGITNQQKFAFHSDFKPSWASETEKGASLADVYRFYFGESIDKSVREKGMIHGYPWMFRNAQDVLRYNVEDIVHTTDVVTRVSEEWLDTLPSEISRIAFLLKSQYIVPMSPTAREWYEETEEYYQERLNAAKKYISVAAEVFYNKEVDDHPQIAYLDSTPAKSGYRKGMPKYKRDLFNSKGELKKVSLLADITPVFLGLKYSDQQDESGAFINHEYLYLAPWEHDSSKKCWRTDSWVVPDPTDGYDSPCQTLFTKDNAKTIFENGQITSDKGYGQEIISFIVSSSVWKSIRKRANTVTDNIHRGFALVNGCQSGTVTRRYTHPYWMVLPNPKGKKIGTEVKAQVHARPGYNLTIKDFAGQEAHLAALVSTISRGIPGSNMFSYTLALGDKAKKTDIHNIIAASVGINRGYAKNGFYGAMYGIGVKGLTALFKSCGVPSPEAKAKAFREWLVGKKDTSGTLAGGLASDYFNWLDYECSVTQPVSPALGAKMSKSLAGNKDFKTTRGNWMIQTSGVDCLDLLVVALDELYYREGWKQTEARILITIHDEVWSHVRSDLVDREVLLTQYAHYLCWDYFYEAIGMCGLPNMYYWFPDIGVDKYGRKEIFVDCKTPSNPDGYPTYSHCNLATKEEIRIQSLTPNEIFS